MALNKKPKQLKKYTAGEVKTAKGLDEVKTAGFKMRLSEIDQIDHIAREKGVSKSELIRMALQNTFKIEAEHPLCRVGFDLEKYNNGVNSYNTVS